MATLEELDRVIAAKRKEAASQSPDYMQKMGGSQFAQNANSQQKEQQRYWQEALQDAMTSGKSSLYSLGAGTAQLASEYAPGGDYLQKLLTSFGYSPETMEKNALARNAQSAAAHERSPIASFGGEIAGGLLAPIPGVGPAKAAKSLGQALMRAMGYGSVNAGIGGGLNYVPEGGSRLENTIASGLTGAAVAPGVTAAAHLPKIINKLRPSSWFDNGVPEKVLRENLRAAQGTETGLGNIIESPFLQAMQDDILAKLPLSGTQKTQARTGAQVRKRGNELYEDLIAGESLAGGTPGEAAQKELKNAYEAVTGTSGENYGLVEEVAKQSGVKVKDKNVRETAKSFKGNNARDKQLGARLSSSAASDLDMYANSELLAGELKKADLEKNIKNLNIGAPTPNAASGFRESYKKKAEKKSQFLPKTIRPETIDVKRYGAPAELIEAVQPEVISKQLGYDLDTRNILKGDLMKESKNKVKEGKTYEGQIYSGLSKGIKRDINDAIAESGNQRLKDIYDAAESYYGKNVAPFNKGIMSKYINDDSANPDMLIPSFFRLGKKDNAYLAQRFTENLAHSPNFEGGMASIRKGLYQDALMKSGLVNPNKLATRFEGTGDNLMRQALKGLSNPEEMAQRIRDYQNLTRMNQKAIAPMYSPVNGYKATSVIPLASIGAGATTGFGLAGPLGAIGGGLLGSGLGFGQLANKALTSESTRNNFVEKMIKNRANEGQFNDDFSRGLAQLFAKSAGAKTGKSNKEEKK